jgi:hypothetical protein
MDGEGSHRQDLVRTKAKSQTDARALRREMIKQVFAAASAGAYELGLGGCVITERPLLG